MMLSEDPHQELNDKMHDDSSNWRWGIFYYNKNDARVIVRKRVQVMGWTLNFANPYSILIMLLLIIVMILIPVFFK
jgi:uncharacterized membrane protein